MRIEAKRTIDADAGAVFAMISDVERLSIWNRAIRSTVEAPTELADGAEWVVQLHALGQSWPSRSTVVTHDPIARRFTYRSQTDDGNRSYAEWNWVVSPTPSGCVVEVRVDLRPATFWRRVLLVRIRGRQLRHRELPDSLDQLARATVRTEAR